MVWPPRQSAKGICAQRHDECPPTIILTKLFPGPFWLVSIKSFHRFLWNGMLMLIRNSDGLMVVQTTNNKIRSPTSREIGQGLCFYSGFVSTQRKISKALTSWSKMVHKAIKLLSSVRRRWQWQLTSATRFDYWIWIVWPSRLQNCKRCIVFRQ